MKCPFCSHDDDRVIDSRATKEGAAVRRRRECVACNRRYTTYEYIEDSPLLVVKRDGRREPFDRAKLLRGVKIALAKRPVSGEIIARMVAEIEDRCHELGAQEISSERIGEMVMAKLRAVDEVAYIRFASVYRRFQDAGEFRRELESM